jgi:hypothetical protein
MESRLFAQFWLYFVLVTLCSSTVAVQSAEPTPELHAAFEQLNAVDFMTREQASQSLQQAGPAALPLLKQGLASEHEEVRWRCAAILEKLAVADSAIAMQTIETIRSLPADQAAKFAPMANELVEKSRMRRHELAVQQLSRLGAELNLPEPALEAFAMEAMLMADEAGVIVADEIAFVFGGGVEIEFGEDDAPLLELAVPPIAGEEGVEDVVVEDDFVEDDAAPPLPELAEKIAALVLPGRVGRDLRKAIGIPPAEIEPLVEAESLLSPEAATPVDFALPKLEDASEIASVLHAAAEDAAEEVLPEAVLAAEEHFLWTEPLSSLSPENLDTFNLGTVILDSSYRGSEATLTALRDIQKIGAINIEGKKFTDAALEHIFSVTTLRHLHLQQTSFSAAALLQQHRAHPEVGVMAIGSAVMGVNGSLRSAPCQLRAVVPGSGAHQAGLRPGDVIEAIDGEQVRDFSELTILVQSRQPGDELIVKFRRDDRSQQVRVKLAARS